MMKNSLSFSLLSLKSVKPSPRTGITHSLTFPIVGMPVKFHLPAQTRCFITIFIIIFNWVKPSGRKKKSFQLDLGKPPALPWEWTGPHTRHIYPWVGTKIGPHTDHRCTSGNKTKWILFFRRNTQYSAKFQHFSPPLSARQEEILERGIWYPGLGAADLLSLASFIYQSRKHKCQSSHDIFAPIKSSAMLSYHTQRGGFMDLHKD